MPFHEELQNQLSSDGEVCYRIGDFANMIVDCHNTLNILTRRRALEWQWVPGRSGIGDDLASGINTCELLHTDEEFF